MHRDNGFERLTPEAVGSFFVRNQNIRPFAKVGFKGFDGGGKSLTALLTAIGLAKLIGTEKPVTIVDSEEASQFFLDEFEKANLPEPFYRPTSSFADLRQIMRWMDEGLSDILLIDQTAAYHDDFEEMYKLRPTLVGRPARTRLEIDDRMAIKDEWKDQFSKPFVSGRWHGIFCARAAYVWENEYNEDAGRRESFTNGTKMRGDNEAGHDPDLVVLMEFDEASLVNRAKITKDRSRTIHGKMFDNPTFETFKPYFDKVLRNPATASLAPVERPSFSADDLKAQEYRRNCQIQVEEIEGLIIHAIPGQAKDDKQHRLDIIHRVFGTFSDKEWQQNRSLTELLEAKKKIQDELVSRGFAEYCNGIYHVKGTPPISEEHLAGGEASGYGRITPKPLRMAHDGLEKLETPAPSPEQPVSSEPQEKKRRKKVLDEVARKAWDDAIVQCEWTPSQVQSLLATRKLAKFEDMSAADYEVLYMKLFDLDTRNQFPTEERQLTETEQFAAPV